MLMFRSKFMIQCLIHQESCYLMIFCISQGSVVTHLRGGGKYDEPCYKFNTESNSERTFFLNRSTFSQTYKRRSSGTFLRPTVYGPVMLSFRDMTTGRTTDDGRTNVGKHRISGPKRTNEKICSARHSRHIRPWKLNILALTWSKIWQLIGTDPHGDPQKRSVTRWKTVSVCR